jgi:SAM-dependent methyltransferase
MDVEKQAERINGNEGSVASAGSRYESHYASGGFGYEPQRVQRTVWAWLHYVKPFKLGPPVPLPGRRPSLLDIPCGDGFWTSVMARLGFDAQGIDLSPEGVAQAKARYPKLTFHQGNAEEALPVPDRSFDVVFSRAISHLHPADLTPPRTLQMAANLMRYVKDDGQLLVSYYTKRDGGGTKRHHYHPVSDLVRLFEQVGDVWRVDVVDDFVQLGVRHRGSPPPRPWSERLGRSTLALGRRFAGQTRARS